MSRLLIPLLLGIAPLLAEVQLGQRVKLGATPDKIVAMYSSKSDAERTRVAELFGGTVYSCRVTYWQLDGDAYREAILEAAGGGAMIYLFLDQDAEGWWHVGNGSASLRGSAGFRVMNWPDERSPRSVIVEGAARYGTGLYVQGITVFRLDKGRLTQVLEPELHGYSMTMGYVAFPYRYTQSFVREEPHRFLVAEREILSKTGFDNGPPRAAFRGAKVTACVEHARDGSKRELAVSECARVTTWMPGATD